jgi:hypothetical protein
VETRAKGANGNSGIQDLQSKEKKAVEAMPLGNAVHVWQYFLILIV